MVHPCTQGFLFLHYVFDRGRSSQNSKKTAEWNFTKPGAKNLVFSVLVWYILASKSINTNNHIDGALIFFIRCSKKLLGPLIYDFDLYPCTFLSI